MTLEHEMERLGRLIAYDRNLKVDVRGTRAYSVPGRVVIPNAETYVHLGVNAERMLHGLLDHECGHARFTDHSIMERARKKGGESLASLVNALEDGRIERLMGAEFIGARQNLHRKNRWFWEDPKWQECFTSQDAWGAFCTAVTLYLRRSVEMNEIERVRPEVADLVRVANAFGLDHFDRLSTSEEVYQLAVALWERFCEPPPPEPDESDEEDDSDSDDASEGEPDGEPEPGDASDNNSASSGGQPDDSEEDDSGAVDGGESDSRPEDAPESSEDGSEGSESPSEPEDAEADDAPEGEGDGSDSEGEGPEGGDALNGGLIDPYRALRTLDLRDWRRDPDSVVDPEEAIAKLMQSYEQGDAYRVFSHEFDLMRDLYAEPLPEDVDREVESAEAIERDARLASAALTQAFEVALKARRERRPIGGNDEGEVDLDLLGEYAVGSASSDVLYRQWVAEDDRAVTVAILLDCSGSMHDRLIPGSGRAYLARRVAYAMHLALSACQVDHEITGFTTISSEDYHQHLWMVDRPQLEEHFDRMRTAMIEASKHGVDPGLFARELWRWRPGARSRSRRYDRFIPTSAADAVLKWPLLVPIHAVFKPYGVNDASALRYAMGIHENLDGEAVLWQARRLASRPEPRRVMFVLSDGMPSGARHEHASADFLKEAVQRVLGAGIEVYGIGIETEAVRHFYPRYAIAHSIEHLMEVALGSLVEVITEGRIEVECVQL